MEIIVGLVLLAIVLPTAWRNLRNSKQTAFDPGNPPPDLLDV